MSSNLQGRVIAIVGPAVDVEFDSHLPEIMNALLTEITDPVSKVTSTITLEVPALEINDSTELSKH